MSACDPSFESVCWYLMSFHCPFKFFSAVTIKVLEEAHSKSHMLQLPLFPTERLNVSVREGNSEGLSADRNHQDQNQSWFELSCVFT